MTEPSAVLAGFALDGRVAVVTGAASGIGRASARALAGAGAIVVCADLSGDGAEATASAIRDAGGSAEAKRVDVTQRADVEALVAGAVAAHGRLDVMANIAGIIHSSPVLDTTDEELDRIMAVNFKGTLYGCQAAGRVMAAAGRGSIVNLASGAVDQVGAGLLCYGVSKVAVVQLTRNLAVEIGKAGVRVNAIAPGFIVTAMTARHFTDAEGNVDEVKRAAVLEPMAKMTPLRRNGEADDVAMTVLFLASDASSYVTGQILRPNGGMAMPW